MFKTFDENIISYEERVANMWKNCANDYFVASPQFILYQQCNNNAPMREYRGEVTELSQELYEDLVKMYAVPYAIGDEALWTSWVSCGTLPKDGKLRRPTYWEAQLRFNMQNHLGVTEFIKCCKEYKERKIHKPKELKGWVDNEC